MSWEGSELSYSTDMANLLANQLSRFATLNRYQLVGQLANLNFWLEQVHNSLAVFDGYGVRFVNLQSAQGGYVATHGVAQSRPDDSFPTRQKEPSRVPHRELQKARKSLVAAASRFLNRCRQDGLISEADLSKALKSAHLEELA